MIINVVLFSFLISAVLMCKHTCKPESCLDIYKEDSRNPSGNYIIYPKKQAIQVYCSFEGDYGYTFISRKFSGSTIDLSSMYSTKKFAKIRILKRNGEQREVTVENLSSYKSRSTLSFNYNSHPNYQGPRPRNKGLHPYLFLGFLPAKLARNKNIQGYRAAGKDLTFRNCDANPNSYLTFYFNPRNKTPLTRGWSSRLITEWIRYSTLLEYPQYMDKSLYMDWEMHMGGCGGLATSTVVSYTKAALGIPFHIPGTVPKYESCLDIYKHNSRNPSGNYIIYQNKQAIQVYCSFEGDYGYTFISRKFGGSTINLSSMYSTKDFAKIRILKRNGEQKEVTVENLSSYKSRSTLSFNYNSHPNYQGPRPWNRGLHPYLFLGFLPAKLSRNKNIQGYRAAGKDFTFRNCDANPNSYLTFYFNPRNRTPLTRGWSNRLITEWIRYSTLLKKPHYMDRSFYMDWEMHMGGCGGLATSTVVSYTKAALGIPFHIPGTVPKYESCLDIYKHNSRNPSGNYIIYQNKQAIQVYCSFEGDYGYTFISRKLGGSTINLSSMYSTKDFAKIRILKSNGEQREVTVENLSSYKSRSTLSFNYNSHPNYQGPRPRNRGLHPYLFLGFLPAKLSRNKNIQGYRAAGKDFTFRNCDANPNSYLTFYFNPRNRTPLTRGWSNRLITQWIRYSTLLKKPHYMDRSFYMDWEMHMGGCGGLATSTVVSYTKAALGIPFRLV